MSLQEEIKKLEVSTGNIAIFWLGNAGFVLKSAQGEIIYIDPYLSNCAERLYGFQRIYPSLITEDEVEADYVLISHEHGDHLDVDSIPSIMEQEEIKLIAPQPCIDKCCNLGVNKDKLLQVEEGSEVELNSCKVRVVFADHGDLAPQAVGYMLDFAGTKVYYTGDTAYTPDKMELAFGMEPEVLIAPINGKFNNLNPLEAALVTRDCKVEVVIPSHFWMFAEHNGNPGEFVEYVDYIAPEAESELITLGDYYLYSGNEENR
ncbi:MBL fold metallo-hydrolase [Acetohalobium arabaticum]|uniref:Metal-dependent hydrolase n=1 Tax=Acetohalobium arabaticum (strain ATCC 49924 / DSM 5501 / Z-7288) TaxID=574087 RepID=D9QPP0_ACEAZ|nr:MBL fold metallo-hydrolase [Acetohalobium arabaticum]ADL12481.1 metal-dependent hydrolase [Acetohalobium arabaticum DSM 5501]